MNKLTVEIKGKDYQIEKEVFDLIHSVSLERDELKKGLTNGINLIRVCHNVLGLNSLFCPKEGFSELKKLVKKTK